MSNKDDIAKADAGYPSVLPDQDVSDLYLVMEDGETFGGALNARVTIVDSDLVREFFPDGLNDFNDLYDELVEGKATIELQLDEVLSYLALNFGGFRQFVRARRLAKIRGDELGDDIGKYVGK